MLQGILDSKLRAPGGFHALRVNNKSLRGCQLGSPEPSGAPPC
jgi:hypothetical protein